MSKIRGIAFDVTVAVILAAFVSSPVIYTAVAVHRAVKRALRFTGVL